MSCIDVAKPHLTMSEAWGCWGSDTIQEGNIYIVGETKPPIDVAMQSSNHSWQADLVSKVITVSTGEQYNSQHLHLFTQTSTAWNVT